MILVNNNLISNDAIEYCIHALDLVQDVMQEGTPTFDVDTHR